MRYVTIALALGLMGCGWGRPALMVELNGRKVEFDEYRSGKIPRGVEVSHMDASSLQVQGSQPIEVR